MATQQIRRPQGSPLSTRPGGATPSRKSPAQPEESARTALTSQGKRVLALPLGAIAFVLGLAVEHARGQLRRLVGEPEAPRVIAGRSRAEFRLGQEEE